LPLLAAAARLTSGDATNQFLATMFFLAALAAALGDWTSTELGKTYGKRTYQLITFERVRSGTRGAVSVAGSVYGGLAALAFATLAAVMFHTAGLGRHVPDIGPKETIVVVLAAALANHIESVIGGILAQFQRNPNKQALNFTGSLIAGALAVFFTNLPEG
jgi:uncharacterized protein (TIGR00297 family)